MGRGRPPNGAEWLTIQLCRAFEAHVLSEPEQAWAAPPLPAAFGSAAELYSSMKALVLDEAFAMVREGLASRKRALTLRMRIDATLRASERGARLAALSVTAVGASAPDLSSALRSGSVFLLSRGECQLLAVLDGRSQAWASRNPNPSANPNPDPDSDPNPITGGHGQVRPRGVGRRARQAERSCSRARRRLALVGEVRGRCRGDTAEI